MTEAEEQLSRRLRVLEDDVRILRSKQKKQKPSWLKRKLVTLAKSIVEGAE